MSNDLDEYSVPEYEEALLSTKQHDYCLFVFVINEGNRLLKQLSASKALCNKLDIVVADGGSTDGSVEEHRLKLLGVSALLTKVGQGKLSAQMRMAFEYAIKNKYEGVIVMDGNGKDDPMGALTILKSLKKGADHVQGSRYVTGGIAKNTPLIRHLAVHYIHAPLISWAAKTKYTDTTNGFRGYSMRFLEDKRVQPFRSIFHAYELHYYLAIRASTLGFKTLEVPVTREYPSSGNIPTKISPIKGNALILKTLMYAVFGKYNPKTQ